MEFHSPISRKAVDQLRFTLIRLGFAQEWYLIIIASVIGTITGFAAVGFSGALRWIDTYWLTHHVDDRPWLVLMVLPIVGMFLTGVLVTRFAAEAKGHGVPQVLEALVRRGGKIPLRIGVVKVIASILTVGSGGSAGTEGPIVQIGATAGSVVGQWLHIKREHLQTLVGCGAAAGIASVFNAPIAGVFFTLEILLRDFSHKTFTPIVVASVFSTVATQRLLGENKALFTANQDIHSFAFAPSELPSYIVLGIICGFVALGFNWMIHKFEDIFEGWSVHPLIKPVSGAIGLAVLGFGFILLQRSLFTGAMDPVKVPPFYGNGYDTIHLLLDPDTYAKAFEHHAAFALVMMMGFFVVMKMVATSFTLGSGGSGGVFAPSLFLGATTGAALGALLQTMHLIPDGSTPASYALVGMAAVVAGSTHAPLTAILILFEMTRNIYVVLPVMIAAVLATAIAQIVNPGSIYTYKLRRSGLRLGGGRDLSVLRRITVASCELAPLPPEPIYASDPISKLITLHAHRHVPDFVVVEEKTGHYIGMVTSEDLRAVLLDREAIPLLLVAEIMRTDLPVVSRDETLDTVLDKFTTHEVSSLAVVSPIDKELPMAVLTRSSLMKRYREALEAS